MGRVLVPNPHIKLFVKKQVVSYVLHMFWSFLCSSFFLATYSFGNLSQRKY